MTGMSYYRALLLEEAGRPDLAALAEAGQRQSTVNGVGLLHVLRARRAHRNGEAATARKLARQIVDAWSDTDADVPVVVEMRALLEK